MEHSPKLVTVIHGHKEYLCYSAVATVSKNATGSTAIRADLIIISRADVFVACMNQSWDNASVASDAI